MGRGFVAGTKVTIRAIDRSSKAILCVSDWGGRVINRNPTEITVNNNITIVANYQQQTFKVTFKTQAAPMWRQEKPKSSKNRPLPSVPNMFSWNGDWKIPAKRLYFYNVTKDITLRRFGKVWVWFMKWSRKHRLYHNRV